MDPVTINRKHDISEFCTGESQQYALEYIRYDPTEKELQATNGHVLMTVPLEGGDKEFLIRGSLVHQYIRQDGGFEIVAVPDDMSEPLTITVDGLTGPATQCWAKFPDVENVKATVRIPKATVLLDAEYVRAIAEYAIRQANVDARLRISITEPDDVAEIVVQRDGEKTATAIVMPVI